MKKKCFSSLLSLLVSFLFFRGLLKEGFLMLLKCILTLRQSEFIQYEYRFLTPGSMGIYHIIKDKDSYCYEKNIDGLWREDEEK